MKLLLLLAKTLVGARFDKHQRGELISPVVRETRLDLSSHRGGAMKRFQFWAMCCLVGLLGAGLQHYLNSTVKAAAVPAWSGRKFYLTKNQFQGNQAPNACASDYHMASYWEIHEVSNLQYDTALGIPADDSGSGPPVSVAIPPTPRDFAFGWIRTGNRRSYVGSPQAPGGPNCASWTSNAAALTGTAVSPNVEWGPTGANQAGFPAWMYSLPQCSSPQRVWCVQD